MGKLATASSADEPFRHRSGEQRRSDYSPLSVTSAAPARRADRPDLIGDCQFRYKANPKTAGGNTASFQQMRLRTVGTAVRGIRTGPGYLGNDLAILKDFRISRAGPDKYASRCFNAFQSGECPDSEYGLQFGFSELLEANCLVVTAGRRKFASDSGGIEQVKSSSDKQEHERRNQPAGTYGNAAKPFVGR